MTQTRTNRRHSREIPFIFTLPDASDDLYPPTRKEIVEEAITTLTSDIQEILRKRTNDQ
jgi:hypothetical protein